MNRQERDELRAKHHVGQNEADDQCQGCFTIPYPCDVIKMLDYVELLEQAYEHAKAMGARMTVLFAQSLDELKVVTTPDEETVVKCDPLLHDPKRADWYRFCPKCGMAL